MCLNMILFSAVYVVMVIYSELFYVVVVICSEFFSVIVLISFGLSLVCESDN